MTFSEMPAFASTPGMVCDAIRRFGEEIRRSPELARRLSHVRSWYADQDKNGRWHFGPSKFVGYEGLDAEAYLELSNRGLDGRKTEPRLQQWFTELDSSTDLYACLIPQLSAFLTVHGKVPNMGLRINVCKDA